MAKVTPLTTPLYPSSSIHSDTRAFLRFGPPNQQRLGEAGPSKQSVASGQRLVV